MFKSSDKLHFIKNWYLRLKNGAGCCDTFSLDYYLAPKILKGLKAFRKYSKGSHPMDFKNEEEWNTTLDKMIWAFEYLLKYETDYYTDGEYDHEKSLRNAAKEQEGFELFGKYFRNLWW